MRLEFLAANYSMNPKNFAKTSEWETFKDIYIAKVEAIFEILQKKEISRESNKWMVSNICSNASCRAPKVD